MLMEAQNAFVEGGGKHDSNKTHILFEYILFKILIHN